MYNAPRFSGAVPELDEEGDWIPGPGYEFTVDGMAISCSEGAGSINQTAEQENLWGVPLVQTTQQAAGTAAVLSVNSGAAVVYVREALTTFFDPYSQASSNTYQ